MARLKSMYWRKEEDLLKEQCVSGAGTKFYPGTVINNRQSSRSGISIGSHSHLRGELMVMGYGGKITIGDYVYMGEHSKIWSAENISIGNHVLISHGVNIIDTDSHEMDHQQRAADFTKLITEGPARQKGNIRSAPIIIEDHAWISYGVAVLKGVRIGKGAIVACNSVVTKDVPAWKIVAGNPARIVNSLRDEENNEGANGEQIV
ncbi:MAG: acyltransferase [Candidatus Pseudobacter hemicellulosilyticus]|uniref:Acyltransferase n=1 Tax=Candidatus Pseudobacter hemicellulosilyticus TaxID=3121375 RepID=A0AAJ5WT37_9BACT|nr:MAG: acyltransferase [Pseudobacter sp.]